MKLKVFKAVEKFENSDLNLYSSGDKELVKNVIYDANITKRVFHHLEDNFIAPPELNFK